MVGSESDAELDLTDSPHGPDELSDEGQVEYDEASDKRDQKEFELQTSLIRLIQMTCTTEAKSTMTRLATRTTGKSLKLQTWMILRHGRNWSLLQCPEGGLRL